MIAHGHFYDYLLQKADSVKERKQGFCWNLQSATLRASEINEWHLSSPPQKIRQCVGHSHRRVRMMRKACTPTKQTTNL